MPEDRMTSVQLATLADQVRLFSDARMQTLTRGDVGLAAALRGSVLIYISWNEAIGSPQTPTMAEAFTVTYTFCDPMGSHGESIDCKNENNWGPSPDQPTGVDAQTEAGRHLVIFVGRLVRFAQNQVNVTLRDDVGWQYLGPYESSRPVVVPSALRFSSGDHTVILEYAVVAPIHFEPTPVTLP
jgi:hypothetical protein